MLTYHSEHGQGVIISKNADGTTKVKFEKGYTLDVKTSELSTVLHS